MQNHCNYNCSDLTYMLKHVCRDLPITRTIEITKVVQIQAAGVLFQLARDSLKKCFLVLKSLITCFRNIGQIIDAT
jgi:hypothetical protein